MRNYSKGIFTTSEIAEIVMKKCPGRFASVAVGQRQVNKTIKKLGISDINGKKRCLQISKIDADRIVDTIVNGRTRIRRRKAEQVDLGEFLSGEDKVDWLEPYMPHVKKKEPKKEQPAPVDNGMTAEQVEAVEQFWHAFVNLCNVLGNNEEEI